MMHKVYIEFTSPRKWFQPFAWVVRQFERTPYSHVRLRWTSTTGEELIYEASGSSVKLIGRYAQPLFPVKIHHAYEFNLTREQYRKMIALFRYSSVSYGVWQVLGIALAKLFKLKKNPLARGKYTQVCSELVGRFLVDVLGELVGTDLDTATPRDLKEFLDNYPAATKIDLL